MKEDSLRKYELMVIFSGDLLEKDFERALEELKKLLLDNAKEIFYEESWGKKDLFYRINKQKRGYYVIFDFLAEPQALTEVRASIKLNTNVLRHLLITLPEAYEPEGYKKFIVLEEEEREEAPKRIPAEKVPVAAIKIGMEEKEVESPAAAEKEEEKPSEKVKKAKVAGKEEEEHLKTVEKKLEKILENPDIDIR